MADEATVVRGLITDGTKRGIFRVNRKAFTDPTTFEEERKKVCINSVLRSVVLARPYSSRLHRSKFEKTPREQRRAA